MRVNKNCTVMICVLVNFSLAEDLQLAGVEGKRVVSYVPQVRKEQMVRIYS